MRKISAFLLGLCLLATFLTIHMFPTAPVLAKTPFAILLSCRGDVVVIKQSGESVKGAFGLPLEIGDVIKTGQDSQAEILFEDGKLIEVEAESSMRVKALRTRKPSHNKGKKSFEVVHNLLKLKDSGGTSSMAILRSTDKKGKIRALSPCQTRIRTMLPEFRWTGPTAELLLTIYNEEGIHWQRDIAEDTKILSYPSDAPALVPGISYSWTLETTDPLQIPPLRSQGAFFVIISPEEEKELSAALASISRDMKPGEISYHILRASLFFDHDLLDDAVEETKEALAIDSGNSTLHSILARLYTETGRTEEAVQEYDRLLKQR